jgi:hypothetical protein
MLAQNSRRPLVCSEQELPDPKCAPKKYPSLEQLICSLVYRANNPRKPYPTTNGNCPVLDTDVLKRRLDHVPVPVDDDNIGDGGNSTGTWFGNISNWLVKDRKSVEERRQQSGTVVQRGIESLGAVVAANWLYHRVWRPLQPRIGN